MKQSFNFPHKKGKNYISHSVDKIFVELNEIKIKNIQQLGERGGYFFDCHITPKNNEDGINKIINADRSAYDCLKTQYNDWFNNEDVRDEDNNIDDLYINSLSSDMSMTFILSPKIHTTIIINGEEKDIHDLIHFIKTNKKHKNYVIHIDIIFLGIYINNISIINKWAIKYVNIESLNDTENDWNREEIEQEWKYDIQLFEEEIEKKIIHLRQTVERAKQLYNEILKEDNLSIWENKFNILKSVILKK